MEYLNFNNENPYNKTIVELYNEWITENNPDIIKEMVVRFNKPEKIYFYSGHMLLPALKYMIRLGKLTYSYQNYYMLRSFFKQYNGKKGINWFLKQYCNKAEYNDSEKINQFREFDFVLDFYKCTDIHLNNYYIFFNTIILKSNFLVHPYQDFKSFLQVIIRKRDEKMLIIFFNFINNNKEIIFRFGKKTRTDKMRDGYYWLWYKIQGNKIKTSDWFNNNSSLFFRTFFRKNTNMNDNRETLWEYFILFLNKKNLLPIPQRTDLCKMIYMDEELFKIFTCVFSRISPSEILNDVLDNIIYPDFNGYLIQSILNNWKINFVFLQRLSVKIIKGSIVKNFEISGVNNLNYLIKRGADIKSIENTLNNRYKFIYHDYKSSIKKLKKENDWKSKYIIKQLKNIPNFIRWKIKNSEPVLIKWIHKR